MDSSIKFFRCLLICSLLGLVFWSCVAWWLL
ncbi:hypothetical protein [Pseudoalteromonas phage C7]|nr:hypothetical protein PP587_gp70 [Pseudoalteromonas phage C7]QAY18024.1 hypothetical protein [Pseudoalteromonas phage C7]